MTRRDLSRAQIPRFAGSDLRDGKHKREDRDEGRDRHRRVGYEQEVDFGPVVPEAECADEKGRQTDETLKA